MQHFLSVTLKENSLVSIFRTTRLMVLQVCREVIQGSPDGVKGGLSTPKSTYINLIKSDLIVMEKKWHCLIVFFYNTSDFLVSVFFTLKTAAGCTTGRG